MFSIVNRKSRESVTNVLAHREVNVDAVPHAPEQDYGGQAQKGQEQEAFKREYDDGFLCKSFYFILHKYSTYSILLMTTGTLCKGRLCSFLIVWVKFTAVDGFKTECGAYG